ncbi:LLM class flavin-dependent oxidoreductase [Streptomyces sp. NPDC058232]|uniref:LLM class flavin-dependent oxidoreductase n=1 Tax=Streptomyces sp. NPDC058232 TaxID=3346393 RepID=UPI0036F04963
MSPNRRHMILGAAQWWPGGEHITAWRRPDAQPEAFLDLEYYVDWAKTAERGMFDTLFLADELYVWDRFDSGVEYSSNVRPEPFTLLGALAAVTERIGLAATVSTTYNEPYHTARRVASLDFLSKGRAGWNLVTSASDEEARNFGRDRNVDHATRYERGREFVDVVRGLWDSWDDDALVHDKASGRFADPAKLHTLDHRGKHFTVRGPLNIARPPQGHPLLFQAGASEAGRDLAAATADAVFTLTGPVDRLRDFYTDVKRRAAGYGRSPQDIKVLPMLIPVIGATEEEARAKADELYELTPETLALDLLSHYLEMDLTGRGLDEALDFTPDVDATNQSKSVYERVAHIAADRSVTLGEIYRHLFDERVRYGTPEQIADYMQESFESDAADGFLVMAAYLPAGLHEFVDLVVPLLQKRGLFRTQYQESTLRGHLGLERPDSSYSGGTGTVADGPVPTKNTLAETSPLPPQHRTYTSRGAS